MNPILFFTGAETVSTEAPHAHRLLNLCITLGINFTAFRGTEDGISFVCSTVAAKRLNAVALELRIPMKRSVGRGLPFLLRRLLCRGGLLAGLFCGVFLIWLSQGYVWDVRITGLQTLTVGEVTEELRACGFGVGSAINEESLSAVENRVLLASDRLAWISVHMEGTVAMVQVVERVDAPAEEGKRPANLVASKDGQIEGMELYRGECLVGIGQAVKAGELLVSGVMDSMVVGARYTRAAGRIYARTETEYLIEIPLTYTEKVYDETEKHEIYLNFFENPMKILKSTGNQEGACDIIEKENRLTCFGPNRLPISVTVKTYRPYREVSRTRDHEAARELAYAALEMQLSALSEDTRLLKKDISVTLTEGSLVLRCIALCIENIAVQVEFEVEGLP